MVKTINKSIGLLGGSFDPAHKGHLVISKIAIKKIKLDKVFWLVSKQNPFKKMPFYSLGQRIKKAKKISRAERKIQVKSLDKIVGSSRSIDVINYIINKKKIQNFYFIIGSDNLINLISGKAGKNKINKINCFF